MFRLDKQKIFLLYQYYLLGRIKVPEVLSSNEKEKERFVWFNKCLEKESYLRTKVGEKLKSGWEFSRLPFLERAILIFATYELIFGTKPNYAKIVINQTINFSKVYCGEEKYKYINKVLDLIMKENFSSSNLPQC